MNAQIIELKVGSIVWPAREQKRVAQTPAGEVEGSQVMSGILRSFWSVQLLQLLPEWLFCDLNIIIYLPELKPTNDFLLLFSQSVLSDSYRVDCSTPGFPVLHHLPELAQTHVHWVSDAIQPSHSLSSLSTPAFDLSQHQSLFQWVNSSHQVAKVLEHQLQYQSFQWIFRVDFL